MSRSLNTQWQQSFVALEVDIDKKMFQFLLHLLRFSDFYWMVKSIASEIKEYILCSCIPTILVVWMLVVPLSHIGILCSIWQGDEGQWRNNRQRIISNATWSLMAAIVTAITSQVEHILEFSSSLLLSILCSSEVYDAAEEAWHHHCGGDSVCNFASLSGCKSSPFSLIRSVLILRTSLPRFYHLPMDLQVANKQSILHHRLTYA